MAAPSRSSSSKPGVQLNVIIIGAGIAGLNAAVGLRNAGHRVVVGLNDQVATDYSLTVRIHLYCRSSSNLVSRMK